MRRESHDLYEQAKYDLQAAEKNIEIKQFFVAAFLSQQAAEKALKVLYIEKEGKIHPHTHQLTELGRLMNVPQNIFNCLQKLNPHYLATRYPNAANGVPALQYNEEIANECKKCATEVIEWVEKELKIK